MNAPCVHVCASKMWWTLQQLLDHSRAHLSFNVIPQTLVMQPLCVCVHTSVGVWAHGGQHSAASPLFWCTFVGVVLVSTASSHHWDREVKLLLERGKGGTWEAEEWGAGWGLGAREEDTAPEGNTLCFAVACVDRNQMVCWNTRSLGRQQSQTYG